jgi:hypothetical protein
MVKSGAICGRVFTEKNYSLKFSHFMENLKYHLAENLLTAEPNDYMAQVEVSKSYAFDDVVAEMLNRGTSLTKTDILAVLNLFHQVTGNLVEQGYAMNLPLCNGSPSISGVFNGPSDSFDTNRHYIKYNLNPGTVVRDAVKKIKTEKTDPTDKLPYIEQYFDVASQTQGDVLTPGGIGELQGSRLAFDASDAEQGIWFVATGGAETKVTSVAMNKPAKLIFMVPQLPAGEYEVKIRVKFKGSKLGREAILRKILTVTSGVPVS